jgi:hypothetical protein
MPLLDHFHPPLQDRRHWDGFYSRWAAAMGDQIHEQLPGEYFVEFRVVVGARVEADITSFTEDRTPEPTAVMPAVFPDNFEVQVYSSTTGDIIVVGVIELASPRNKESAEARRAFAAKCAAYLQRGIGVVIVDIVTSCHGNLHDELMALLGHTDGFTFPTPTPLYATAYRPAHRQERNEIDLWRQPLALGQRLPMLPLAVRGLGCLLIDLEGTYTEARKHVRIG